MLQGTQWRFNPLSAILLKWVLRQSLLIAEDTTLRPLGEGPTVADGILQKWPQIISSSTHTLNKKSFLSP